MREAAEDKGTRGGDVGEVASGLQKVWSYIGYGLTICTTNITHMQLRHTQSGLEESY